jgi:hypothetical protein
MGFWFTLFMWVVSFVLQDYFRPSLPNVTPSGNGDFANPTATEGRYVPLMFGTMRNEAPNVIWYGDFAAIERTVETGVIFKKDEGIGYTYFLAMALGLARGESAGITGIWVGDDPVFDYLLDAGGVPQDVVDVTLEDLFGGTDQGGGIEARFRLFNGDPLQAVSAFLDNPTRIDPVSGFRGFSYVVMTDIAETGGANIGESNLMREIRIELQMFATVANGGLGDTLGLGNDHHIIGRDLNPISLHYETWINTDWGEGVPVGNLNLASFQAAAETCFTEGIGYSQIIDGVQDVGDLRDSIEKHIDGYVGPNPITGEIEVILSRDDYDPGTEFQADATNIISVSKWTRGEWTQTNNEVLLQFTNREKNYDDGYAPAQDLANLAIQGRPRSRTIRMSGVHDPSTANSIVWRFMKGFSRPMATGTVVMDRTAYALRPGQIIVVTDEETQLTAIACRITKISLGDAIKNEINLDVVEDIFGTETKGFADPPPSDFIPPALTVVPFLVPDQIAIDSPRMIIRGNDLPNTLPRLFTFVRVTPTSGGSMTEYETVLRERTPPTAFSGPYISQEFVTGGGMTVGTLRDNEIDWASGNGGFSMQIDPLVGSLDSLIGNYSPDSASVGFGGVAVISPGEADEEWICFTSIVDDLGGIRLENLWRGVFDTARYVHSIGDTIWFIWTGGTGMPDAEYTPGDGLDVKLLPRSPTDEVLEAAATALPEVSLQDPARFYNPLLPRHIVMGSANSNAEFSSNMDFDDVLQSPVVAPDAQGSTVVPALKDWRWQNTIEQAAGVSTNAGLGNIWEADEYELQFWMYNLDTHPSPGRGDAISTSVESALAASMTFVTLKDDIAAAIGDNNSFNGRLEIEASHRWNSQVPRQISPQLMFFDFTGLGTWFVPFDAVFLYLSFEHGVAGDRIVRDLSANDANVQVNNTDTGVITTPTPPIGTRGFRFGEDNAFTSPVNSSGYLRVPSVGDFTGELDLNQSFTLEFRWNNDAAVFNDQGIMGQGGTSGSEFRWDLFYMEDEGWFRFRYSTTGTSLNNTINIQSDGVTFFPTIDTWYAIMITKKNNSDGTMTFRSYVDGIRVATVIVANFTIDSTGIGKDLGIGAVDIDRGIVSGVTGDGIFGWLDEIRITQGFALEALPSFTVPVVGHDIPLAEIEPMMTNFQGEAGRDLDKLAEDEASVDTAWVYDGTTAQCRISSTKSKFLGNSLFIDGTNDAGLRWGNFETAEQIEHQNLDDFDFTIEGWVNFDSLPSTKANGMSLAGKGDNGGSARCWHFGFEENDELEFVFYAQGLGAAPIGIVSSGLAALNTDQWYHIAVSRTGDLIEGYVDGTRVINDATFFDNASVPYSINNNSVETSIGKAFRDEVGDLHRTLDGYIDSFRMSRHQVIYTGASFSVPTEPFPGFNPAAGKKLATNDDVYFHSHFGGVETAAHDPFFIETNLLMYFEGSDTSTTMTDDSLQTEAFTAFNNAQIDTAQFQFGSSSLLLDGVADRVESNSAGLDIYRLANNDFTLECWVRFATAPGVSDTMIFASMWDDEPGTANDLEWYFGIEDQELVFGYSTSGTARTDFFTNAWVPAADTWFHVAMSRVGTTIFAFIDGVQQAATYSAGTDTIFDSNVEPFRIGAYEPPGGLTGFMDGWIDEMRLTFGVGRYAPHLPVNTADSRSIKLGGDPLIDYSADNWALTFIGDAFIDTAQSKFGDSSLRLDGTGDHVIINGGGPEFTDKSFLIEGQFRFATEIGTGNATLLATWDTGGNDQEFLLAVRNNLLTFIWNDGSVDTTLTGAFNPAIDVWYHIMVTKVLGTTRLFVDGTQVGLNFEPSTTTRQIDNTGENMTIGVHFIAGVATDRFNGWVDRPLVLNESKGQRQRLSDR